MVSFLLVIKYYFFTNRDLSFGGVVSENETYEQNAKREL